MRSWVPYWSCVSCKGLHRTLDVAAKDEMVEAFSSCRYYQVRRTSLPTPASEAHASRSKKRDGVTLGWPEHGTLLK